MRRIEERGKVTFDQAIKDYIQGWVSYGGRSTRAGYWWAFLGEGILGIASGIGYCLLSAIPFWNTFLKILLVIVGIFMLIAQLALTFRRFRDVGFKTAPIVIWWICDLFVPFVDIIAQIAGFVFTVLPTDQFVAEKENWLVRGKDTVDETQTTAAQSQLTKAAPAETTASTSLPTVVFYPDGREQEIK